uniref:Uncharacterized protein n=1 Tax=Romanomermis culicivorax TaxID=13658 RepID=A0A915JVX4_ROMCU
MKTGTHLAKKDRLTEFSTTCQFSKTHLVNLTALMETNFEKSKISRSHNCLMIMVKIVRDWFGVKVEFKINRKGICMANGKNG